MISNLMRAALFVGCLLFNISSAFDPGAVGSCLRDPRCVRVTYPLDGSEPSFDNIEGQCLGECTNDYDCDTAVECAEDVAGIRDIEDLDNLESCQECLVGFIEYLNGTRNDECDNPDTDFDDPEVLTGEICLGPQLASAMQRKSCCSSDDICFSSVGEVFMEYAQKKLVKDLKVGDKVLTGSGKYETVYTIDHKSDTRQAEFLQLFSTAAVAPLEVTKDHMVFLHGQERPIPAKYVKVGDSLQAAETSIPATVTKITKIRRHGVYNPITVSGSIAVDGIVASAYSAHFGSKDMSDIEVFGYKVMTHHDFIHGLMTPYRAMCLAVSLSLCEPSEEFIVYDKMGIEILSYYYSLSQFGKDVLLSCFVLLVLFFRFCSAATNPFVATGLVLGAGTYFFYSKKN